MTQEQIKQLNSVLTSSFNEFGKALGAHAYFKTHDYELSEDLVQGVFEKTWNYLLKGGNIDTMKSFLFHVLNDSIIDEYRKHKTASLDVMIEKGLEPTDGDHNRFLDTLDGEKTLQLINRLPPKILKVIQLRYLKELSLKEISLITGQSKNTIAVQIHRGLKKIQQLCNPTLV